MSTFWNYYNIWHILGSGQSFPISFSNGSNRSTYVVNFWNYFWFCRPERVTYKALKMSYTMIWTLCTRSYWFHSAYFLKIKVLVQKQKVFFNKVLKTLAMIKTRQVGKTWPQKYYTTRCVLICKNVRKPDILKI